MFASLNIIILWVEYFKRKETETGRLQWEREREREGEREGGERGEGEGERGRGKGDKVDELFTKSNENYEVSLVTCTIVHTCMMYTIFKLFFC